MTTVPPIVIVIGVFTIFVGCFCGLYALMTRGQRRTIREIRREASERGWNYRLRRWQGNPTAFRIDGQTHGGLPWVMKSSSTRGYDRGWSATLVLRFPMLAGATDFAIVPRAPGDPSANLLAGGVSPAVQAQVTALSGAAADAVAFLRDARDVPSGVAAFDTVYQVLTQPEKIAHSPVDHGVAERIINWPAGSIHPHSMLAWRDPFGLVVEARLPAPANWATVAYLLEVGEALCDRLPASGMSPAPRTLLDRVIARVVQ